MALSIPSGPTAHEEKIREQTGLNPLKVNLPAVIEAVFLFQVRGFFVFPPYMRAELKHRVIGTVKSRVNLMRAQGDKVTQEKVDEMIVEALHRDGVALAANEDDAVHILVPECPRLGDEREVEGKAAKVSRRYLMHDNGTTRVVIESLLLPPAPSDTLVKEIFTVADSRRPPPVMSETEKAQKISQLSEIAVQRGSEPVRAVAYTSQDVDKVLHEDLLGKEMPKDQTPEEAHATRAAMEEALFARDDKEARSGIKAPKSPVDLDIEAALAQSLGK